MAEPVGKLVLNVIKDDCSADSCPYRYGDGATSLMELVNKKLKHRVSDGNEVRALGRRVKELEAAVTRALEASDKNRKLNQQEIEHLKNALKKERDPQG